MYRSLGLGVVLFLDGMEGRKEGRKESHVHRGVGDMEGGFFFSFFSLSFGGTVSILGDFIFLFCLFFGFWDGIMAMG